MSLYSALAEEMDLHFEFGVKRLKMKQRVILSNKILDNEDRKKHLIKKVNRIELINPFLQRKKANYCSISYVRRIQN